MEIKAPTLDDRTSEMVFKQTIELAKQYCPEWALWLKDPDRGQINDDPGLVMFRLFSKMTEHLINQMNRIPDKHRIAFLDFMGIDLFPAKPSMVPLTFYIVKKASGARIPQGTLVAARPTKEMVASKIPEILFETLKELDVVPVRMSAVYSLNPWEDKYTDHLEDAFGKDDGFLVFGKDPKERPLDHILYMGDDDLFDIRRKATLTIRLYGENLVLKNYFAKWYIIKDDGSTEILTPDIKTGIGLDPLKGIPFVEAKFSNCDKINKSKINNLDSFWLSVKPKDGVEIQDPFNWDEIPKLEKNRFLKFITWNFGSEWGSSTVEKIDKDIHISLGNELITLEYETNNKAKLDYSGSTYIFLLEKTAQNKLYMHHQPIISAITADVTVENILPEMAFYNNAPIEANKGFYPFGEIPRALDTLYIGSDEAFSKEGSKIVLDIVTKDDLTSDNNIKAELIWEFWNGTKWEEIDNNSREFEDKTINFKKSESVKFICPSIEEVEINGKTNRWIRVRIRTGLFGEPSKIAQSSINDIITKLELGDECNKVKDTIKKQIGTKYTFFFNTIESTLKAPFIKSLLIKYTYLEQQIKRIKSYNNFKFKEIKTVENKTAEKFEPYEPSIEKMPALYLGFEKDESLLGKPISIFFSVKEKLYKEPMIEIENPDRQVNLTTMEKASGFAWEYYNGTSWENLVSEDETDSFNIGGIVTFILNSSIAGKPDPAHPPFGKDLYWIRIISGDANKISCPKLKGIFPNSVWAKNRMTVENEILGSGNGKPDQTLSFSRKPILEEQIIEVKEGSIPSDVEQEKLRSELGVSPLRKEIDVKTGEITEVWVRWNEVRNFSLSDSLSRHYIIDRANGMIIFGNGVRGMLPPRGKNNILARKFMSGGSLWGNCKAGTIEQLKRKIPGIEKVTNHISASGGMDPENLKKAVERAPHSLKNRDRAVTKEDFEWLAREASQDVAWAKCITEMKKINIIIVPNSTDNKPLPEAGLLDEVKRHLEERALLSIGGWITTSGPDYRMINATVKFEPEDMSEGTAVSEEIQGKLKKFLHPVHGGQDRDGWDFGEKIFLSEVAAIIQGTKGVKSIKEITLEKFVYLFCWDDIPGYDNEKLKEYLTKKYSIDWVKNAIIKKSGDNKNIEMSQADYKVTLTLNDERNKVDLNIDKVGKKEGLTANLEKNKLNIFESREIKSGLGWITIENEALPYAGQIDVIPDEG